MLYWRSALFAKNMATTNTEGSIGTARSGKQATTSRHDDWDLDLIIGSACRWGSGVQTYDDRQNAHTGSQSKPHAGRSFC